MPDALVTAVADAFSAMTTDRPYRFLPTNLYSSTEMALGLAASLE